MRAAKAPATLRAYRSDGAHFEAWCQTHQLSAFPAEPATVALYLTDLAACRAAGTINQAAAEDPPTRAAIRSKVPPTQRPRRKLSLVGSP